MDNGKNVAAAARDAAIQQFNVGTRVQLRVQRDGGQLEYFSSLIGFVKDEFLLVKSPVIRKLPVVLHDGETVQVRAFTGTTIYSFSATVERTFLSPLYYMQLSYPHDIDSAALRSALRVKVDLPATVAVTGGDAGAGGESVQGRLVNLSISGAALETDRPIAVGAQLRVAFNIQGDTGERLIQANAVVRGVHVRPATRAGDGEIVSCGLQFHGIESVDLMAIRLLTYETLLQDRQNLA